MEFKGKFNGADVYDDYAHHPDELKATLEAVRSMGYKRVVLAFQPHTYSRTKALFDDFVRELKKSDVVVLAEIYAAGNGTPSAFPPPSWRSRSPVRCTARPCQTSPPICGRTSGRGTLWSPWARVIFSVPVKR